MRRILGLLPILFSVGLVGCETMMGGARGPQESATRSLSDSRQLMDQVRAQIDRTMYSLDSLMRAPPAEIRDVQARYANDVGELSRLVDQLEQSARSLRAQRIDYLTEWERTQFDVEDRSLRQAAEQRQRTVTTTLANAESSLRTASNAVTPLVAELEDIRRVSAADPTPAGIAAIKRSGIPQSTQQQASSAGQRLDLAAAQFDRALAALAPEPGTRPVGAAGAARQRK